MVAPALWFTTALSGRAIAAEPRPLQPPVAARRPQTSVHHGITRTDDYAWLRDSDWREVIKNPSTLEPDIRLYIEAENAYAEATLAPLEGLRATLNAELKGRIEQADSSVPLRDGPYRYWSRYLPGAEQMQYVRAPREEGPIEVMLDADLLAKGRSYFAIGAVGHSPDHKYFAYLVDTSGSEAFDLYYRELGSAQPLPPWIIRGVSDFAWAPDGKSIFYVRRDDEFRARILCHHRVGSNPETDLNIYEEPDTRFSVNVYRTSTRKRMIVGTGSSDTSEAFLLDPNDPARLQVIAPRREGVQYYADDLEDDLVIRTNADQAEDFKIVTVPVASPGADHWKDMVAYRQGVQVENVVTRAGFVARLELEEGQHRLVIRETATGTEHTLDFAEEAYVLGLMQPPEYGSPIIRITYSSPVTPQRTYDYDMATRQLTLRRQQRVPSGHDTTAYVVRRLMAPAPDGETIPITVLYRKGLALDGSAPAFLTGYGAYANNMTPDFNENAFSLVDRGFVHASAHVRGGMEKGNRWREGGRLKNKKNTFTDFIAATEHLIRLGYTAKGRIVANGGSAGGQLVGAVANMRPDLYAGMVATVPFVDCLTTMLDESLPLTTTDRPEWGDPIVDADAYRTIAAYSPYDNVKPQDYPALFVTAGISDPRVTYWEPAKWVAKLRATKTDDRQITLLTRMSAGHFGASGRFQGLDEVARAYAFALDVVGSRDVKLQAAPQPVSAAPR
jgi:oligopeptidase B